MKKKLTFVTILACCIGLLLIESCKKPEFKGSTLPTPSGYSKYIEEIGLRINFNFKRATPDDFNVSVSDNFSIQQKSSLYNKEQEREYFTLRCKRSDGTSYHIAATVDASNNIIISFQETPSVDFL